MICSSCHTVYAPSDKELGKVDTLAGLCEKCGAGPHFLPFAMAYVEGAIVALITIEFVMLVFLAASAKSAIVLAGSVLGACLAMYLYARRSATVRYANEREKKAATWPHRLLGLGFGLATSTATFFIILSSSL